MRWDVVERDGTTLALEDRWKGFTDEVLKRMEEARTTEDAMAIWKILVIGSGGYRDARKSLVTLPQSTSICLLHSAQALEPNDKGWDNSNFVLLEI